MIIYAVYIIKNDGSPLLSEYFQSEENLPNSVLLGGLVTAIKGFTTEVLQDDMRTIEVEGLAYHVRSFGFYNIVLVTDLSKEPGKIIQELGLRFMMMYGEEMLEKANRVDKFTPFKDTIKEIIGIQSFDESGSIKPSKILNTKEIFDLNNDLQAVALAMISLGEGTISQIAEESEIGERDLEQKLDQLQKLGYLGKKTKNEMKVYFCTTY